MLRYWPNDGTLRLPTDDDTRLVYNIFSQLVSIYKLFFNLILRYMENSKYFSLIKVHS